MRKFKITINDEPFITVDEAFLEQAIICITRTADPKAALFERYSDGYGGTKKRAVTNRWLISQIVMTGRATAFLGRDLYFFDEVE